MIAGERDALDCIDIPIPCKASWDDMVGDERVRHCGDCRQNVYNIAAFSRREATRLLQERTGRVCLRIFRRPDGTVITDDCRARLRAARKRGLLIFAGTLVIVAWAQICAQFVGLRNLRRVMSPSTTTGVTAVPAEVKPVPVLPQPTMGPPPLPREPEPPRKKPRRGHERHHAKMGKLVSPTTVELMGDVVDRR
jgi:hypothetical protein